jgi:hypothetical protein
MAGLKHFKTKTTNSIQLKHVLSSTIIISITKNEKVYLVQKLKYKFSVDTFLDTLFEKGTKYFRIFQLNMNER